MSAAPNNKEVTSQKLDNMQGNIASDAERREQLAARWKSRFDAKQGLPSSIELSEEQRKRTAKWQKQVADGLKLEEFARATQSIQNKDLPCLSVGVASRSAADAGKGQVKSEKEDERNTGAKKE